MEPTHQKTELLTGLEKRRGISWRRRWSVAGSPADLWFVPDVCGHRSHLKSPVVKLFSHLKSPDITSFSHLTSPFITPFSPEIIHHIIHSLAWNHHWLHHSHLKSPFITYHSLTWNHHSSHIVLSPGITIYHSLLSPEITIHHILSLEITSHHIILLPESPYPSLTWNHHSSYHSLTLNYHSSHHSLSWNHHLSYHSLTWNYSLTLNHHSSHHSLTWNHHSTHHHSPTNGHHLRVHSTRASKRCSGNSGSLSSLKYSLRTPAMEFMSLASTTSTRASSPKTYHPPKTCTSVAWNAPSTWWYAKYTICLEVAYTHYPNHTLCLGRDTHKSSETDHLPRKM